MRSRQFAGTLTELFTFSLVLAWPLAAPAADEVKAEAKPEAKADDAADPATRVKNLNRTAMQFFDDLNYAMAEKTLLEALSIVEKSNLGSGPAALSTNGNLAVLYSVGLKKPDKAVYHFKKALAIKPDLKLSKQRATPETEANMARARAEVAGGGTVESALKGAGAPSLDVKPVWSEGSGNLQCQTAAEVKAGEEITLTCNTLADLHPATVMAYYRASGAGQYQVVRMAKGSGAGGATYWVAKIPPAPPQAQRVSLYIEARDDSGTSLATSGEEDTPHVIAVKDAEALAGAEGAPAAEAGGEGDEDDEEDDEGGEEIDDSNPLARIEGERWREHEGSKGTWWFSLGVGSGLGYAKNGPTEAFGKPPYYCAVKAGIAPASTGHLVPEVGYFVGRKTALSLAGRDQGIFGTPAGAATGAHSVLLRALFFTEGDQKVRWYFSLAGGVGEGFRLQVTADRRNEDGTPTGQTVKDTVRGGPFVAGAGAGMLYKLSRHWRLSGETQFLLGFGHISAVLDLTVGTRYQF